jgi:thiamine-phosphate pyrophosphorylase
VRKIADCRLYTFVDTAYLNRRSPAETAEALCRGGSDIIQLRAKGASKEQVLALARDVLPITSAAGVPLVINDHLNIASEVGAEWCHLGQEDFFDAGFLHVNDLAQDRSVAGREMPQIGLSSHAPQQASRAVAAGARYVAVGPVYATGTKPTARPVTLEYVRWAAANLHLPWFAIGGIHLGNLKEVLAAGATRICVVSAILNAPDVAEACQQFRRQLR